MVVTDKFHCTNMLHEDGISWESYAHYRFSLRSTFILWAEWNDNRECLGDYIRRFMCDVICHPCNEFNVGLAKLQFEAWASYQIRKTVGAHAPGMPGTFSPQARVSDPDMHHGTCVTHVPWCMPGSLTSGFLWSRRRGKTFPAFPAHAQPAMLRIWQEAHGMQA